MDSLSIIAHQTPGTVTFDNYEEIKATLQKRMRQYPAVGSLDDLDVARNYRDEIKKDWDTISKVKKQLEEAYSRPYKEVEDKLNELLAIVDKVYKPFKSYVNDAEKKQKNRTFLSLLMRWLET